MVIRKPPVNVPFRGHIDLLRLFLAHRESIAASIEALLKADRRPIGHFQDRALLTAHFEDCFFRDAAISQGHAPLRGQLEHAHWTSGFQPRELPGLHSDLIHPAEMMMRAFHLWQQTRWPGRQRRMRFAHTLFNVYVVRCLQFLSMRIWDEGSGATAARLSDVQGVLDGLWHSSPADQPRFVRDARWLIPLAQSLPTDDLAAYLEVAREITDTLPAADALEVQKAQVRMLGGHLTSQIRHLCTKDGAPISEPNVVLRTRTSNALDFALLIQGLVALLRAYDAAVQSGDSRMRLEMAGAIFQGLSADPELFLNRINLMSAYSMMEHVFVVADADGGSSYSPLGKRHRRLLDDYGALIRQLAPALRGDLPRFRPVDGGYSPYGVVFGYPSTLTELMALKAFEPDAETRFSLEDVFQDVSDDSAASVAKLAWVNGWRKLPHIPPEVQRQYDYPQQFAEEIYTRIAGELERCEPEAGEPTGTKPGRLYLVSTEDETHPIPQLAARYFHSSDPQIAEAQLAAPYGEGQLRHGQQEGHYLVSYETPGGWTALKKELLDEVLGAGHDAKISGLPRRAVAVLRLMCPDMVQP